LARPRAPSAREGALVTIRAVDEKMIDVAVRDEDGREGTDVAMLDETLPAAPRDASDRGRAPEAVEPGARLDRFVVVGALGRGGMGVVVSAYDPTLDRKVAIKLLRPDRDGKATGAGQLRLLREAQAMARLSHPNVVVVHEVGTVGDQVFIAMEHVDGETLSSWLARRPRSWRHTLAIFLEAGRGLVAAHDAGLIHRDFKADNVLVGADGRVRVTDFGLAASSTESGAGDRPPGGTSPFEVSLTRTSALVGTPVYMAPEQHLRGTVTPAADQFAFCVALYEALYGERPFGGTTYAELSASVLAYRVRPAPPDARVPGWLRDALLRGLRPDPAERHASMAVLLAALSRDSGARRRVWLASALLAIPLAAVAVAASRGAPGATCRPAPERLAGSWDAAISASVRAAFVATGRPYALDTHARVKTVLDQYTANVVAMRVEACLATRERGEQSELLLDLRMACLDRRLNRVKELTAVFAAAPDPEVLDRAVGAATSLAPVSDCADRDALIQASPLPSDPEQRARIAAVEERLERAAALDSSGKYAEAAAMASDAIREARATGHLPVVAAALFRLGSTQRGLGDPRSAEATLGEAARVAAQAGDDLQVAESLVALLYVVGASQTRYRDGLAMLQAIEPAVARAGDPPLLRARLHETLGDVLRLAEDLPAARAHLDRAMALYLETLGPDHERVGEVLDSLGLVLSGEGQFEEGFRQHQRALETFEKVLGPGHPKVGAALYHMGSALQDRGRYEEARAYYTRSLAVVIAALGPEHSNVAYTRNALGDLLRVLGERDAARAELEQALAIWERALGPDHAFIAFPLRNLGTLLDEGPDRDLARRYHERALAVAERALGPDHSDVAECAYSLGHHHFLRGAHDEARRLYERALAIWERTGGPDHPYVAWALTGIGETHVGSGSPALAIPPLERALAIRVAEQGDVAELARTRFVLARALWNTRRDRRRAVDLARQARADCVSAGRRAAASLAEIDGWLARRT
jgi:serine/threonine-protein kinase